MSKSFKDYEKEFHKVSSRHVLEVELLTTTPSKFKLLKISNNLRVLSNQVIHIVNKRLKQLFRDKSYNSLKTEYGLILNKINSEKDKSKLKELLKQKQSISSELEDFKHQYQVDWNSIRTLGIIFGKNFNINSVYILTEMENINKGVEKVLYDDGKYLHFKKKGTLPSIRAKQPNRGIVPFIDKDDNLKIKIGNSKKEKQLIFDLKYKDNDLFILDEFKYIKNYIKDPSINEKIINDYIDFGIIQNTYRICYTQIVFKEIRKVIRVYAQFVLEGDAVPKKNKLGLPRHHYKKGFIGLDLGTSTFAAVSENELVLKNLAERNNKSTRLSEKKETYYLRKMDNSKRINNPNNYNPDGTIKKDTKLFKKKWTYSKNYKKYKYRFKELNRKNSLNRKYAIQTDVNYLKTLGDTIITEENNIKALQKRVKNTKISDKETLIKKKDGTEIKVHKYKKKKRFGKSIKNRCPGLFNKELKKKLKVFEVNTKSFRASQYDHKDDKYIKKDLKQRQHIFKDGDIIQRDLYSAFLLFCSDDNLENADKNKCIAYFDNFKILHDKYFEYIKLNNIKINNI